MVFSKKLEIIKLCSKENNITSNAGLEDINNKINMLEEKINDIGNIDFSKIDKKQEDSSNKNITINRSVEKKAETKKIDTSKNLVLTCILCQKRRQHNTYYHLQRNLCCSVF